ncbi:MAG: J domain-containing protein [Spirochaetaceae bacterium]|nr:MAG: J domain-containing protein [Spirochaetaceae bacterium]
MTLDTAYRLFRLRSNATQSELVSAYRKLVKRCHPDFNASRREWSHNAMTRINLAYELLTSDLLERSTGSATSAGTRTESPAGSASDEHDRNAERRFRDDIADSFNRAPAEDPAFVALFDRSADQVLDGIYAYYQYGLQNVYLRHEGVRRFRYRTAVKRVHNGLEQLRDLAHLATVALHRDQLAVFTEFAAAFLRNMLIDKYHLPGANGSENRAYRCFFNGSESLDAVIRAELFEELKPIRPERSVAGGLKVSYHEFMSLLIKHSSSDWVPETLIKLQLHEAFTRVAALRAGA